MPKRTHDECDKAVRMLQANVTPLVIAQQIRCHEKMIEHLRKRFWQIGTMSDRAYSWHYRLMTRRQDRYKRRFNLLNQFRPPVTMIASTTPGTHSPRISAQTVTNRLREIGERLPSYTMYVLYAAFLFWPCILDPEWILYVNILRW